VTSEVSGNLEKRHFRAGYWGLALFVALGIFLEALHATKAGLYLDADNETRRLFWRLAHAHGTLVSILNVIYALTIRARPEVATRTISACLLAAFIALPAGFFLGGAWAKGGDPGIGAALVPVGAAFLVIAVVLIARAVR